MVPSVPPLAFHAFSDSQVVGSQETALETVLVLRQVVSKARFSNIDQLVDIIRSVGRKLVEAQPKGEFSFSRIFHSSARMSF